jgi:hypothetical protein
MVDSLAERINELLIYRESQPEPHIVLNRDCKIIAANAAYWSQFPRRSRQAQLQKEIPPLQRATGPSGRSYQLALTRESSQRERVRKQTDFALTASEQPW